MGSQRGRYLPSLLVHMDIPRVSFSFSEFLGCSYSLFHAYFRVRLSLKSISRYFYEVCFKFIDSLWAVGAMWQLYNDEIFCLRSRGVCDSFNHWFCLSSAFSVFFLGIVHISLSIFLGCCISFVSVINGIFSFNIFYLLVVLLHRENIDFFPRLFVPNYQIKYILLIK